VPEVIRSLGSQRVGLGLGESRCAGLVEDDQLRGAGDYAAARQVEDTPAGLSVNGKDDGQNRNRACFRSATRVKGWMTPAGVMCSSRSWLMTRHSPPSPAVTCAGLSGGEQDPLAEQR
jgi:hypothetical protein